MLPEKMKEAGCECADRRCAHHVHAVSLTVGPADATHASGKWHIGFQSEALLPTSRGYDTYRGYLQGTSRLSSL